MHAFTTRFKGLRPVLKNRVKVSLPTLGSKIAPSTLHEFLAIYDTGATNSVITQKIVDECGLRPTGMTKVTTGAGEQVCETYYVIICLPSKVCFKFVRVTNLLVKGADVLIGMDIISQGDFAVTNYEDKTTFSFRIPSCECIDFVKQKQPPAVRSSSKKGFRK